MRIPIPRARWARYVLGAVGVVLLAGGVWWAVQRPSNDRDWQPNMAVLPWAEFADSLVTVHRVRNTAYVTTEDYAPRYDDRTYDLGALESVWFVVEPFGAWNGVAHTFVSFGFSDGRYLSISVEARKERGEAYSFLKGLFRKYELMYVVADERDAIGLRTNVRRADIYLYPVRTTPERARALFVEMLRAATALRERPRFYNTLTANCTNMIVQHVNALVPGRIPFSWKVVLPGYADQLAHELNLLDTDVPRDELRVRYRINEAAARHAGQRDFSQGLRIGLP